MTRAMADRAETDQLVARVIGTNDSAIHEIVRKRLRSAGSACAGAVLGWPAWCHRKVEAISLLEGERARRRLSLDCTPTLIPWPPSSEQRRRRRRRLYNVGSAQIAVPLTFIEKAPMRSLDVVDAQGRSVSVLGRRDNGLLATAALEAAVAGDLGGRVTPEQWRQLLVIACGDPTDSVLVAEEFIAHHALSTVVAEFVRDTASNFLLCAVLAADSAETRQVLKYSWHWDADRLLQPPSGATEKRSKISRFASAVGRLGPGLGLRDFAFEIALGSPSSAASYHLEVPAPVGLKCRSLDLPPGAGGKPHDVSSSAFGHAYDTYENDPDGNAAVRMNISEHGLHPLVTGAALGTSAIFILALTLSNALATLLANGPGANSLLLFGPATLLAVLVGRRENVVASFVLLPLRLVAVGLSLLLFIGGATLVGALRHPWITIYWTSAAVLSASSAIVLVIGTFRLRSASK